MERLFLKWLQSHIGVSEEVVLGPTDDAALVDFESGEHAVLSTDMLMDGVDFVCSDHGAAAQKQQGPKYSRHGMLTDGSVAAGPGILTW